MYKELCHPTHRAKPHRQHSQRLDIKYGKKKIDDRKMVSAALNLQMQPISLYIELPCSAALMFS